MAYTGNYTPSELITTARCAPSNKVKSEHAMPSSVD